MKRRAVLGSLPFIAGGCLSSLPNEADPSSDDVPMKLGDTIETTRNVTIVPTAIEVSDRLRTSTFEGSARYDRVYVFVRVRTENSGSEPVSLPRSDEFRLLVGNGQYGSLLGGGPILEPIEGEGYAALDQARSGIATEGWLVFGIPREPASAVLSWHDGTGENEEIRWEIDLSDSIEALPIIDVESVTIANGNDTGDRVPIAISLINEGQREGAIDGFLWTEGAISHESEWTASVPPGETVTKRIQIEGHFADELVVNIEPFDLTERFQPAPDDGE